MLQSKNTYSFLAHASESKQKCEAFGPVKDCNGSHNPLSLNFDACVDFQCSWRAFYVLAAGLLATRMVRIR